MAVGQAVACPWLVVAGISDHDVRGGGLGEGGAVSFDFLELGGESGGLDRDTLLLAIEIGSRGEGRHCSC